MANCTITMYATRITPDKNMRVDDLDNYLTTCTNSGAIQIQYQKILPDIKIRLDLEQSEHQDALYNYVTVVNSDDTKKYYYYILGNPVWKSENTVELSLSLDTINTYWSDFSTHFTDKTIITRQHKDRFVKKTVSPGDTIFRDVDEYDEGIQPVKFPGTKYTVEDAEGRKLNWYLVYKTKNALDTSDLNNPLSCYLCADKNMNISNTGTAIDIDYQYIESHAPSSTDLTWYFLFEENEGLLAYFIQNDVVNQLDSSLTYLYKGRQCPVVGIILRHLPGIGVQTVHLDLLYKKIEPDGTVSGNGYVSQWKNITGITVKFLTSTKCHCSNYYNQTDIPTIKSYTELAVAADAPRTILNINNIDRTDSKIMKIIELPYSPIEYEYDSDAESPTFQKYTFDTGVAIYDVKEQMLKILDLNEEFISYLLSRTLYNEMALELPTTAKNTWYSIANNNKYESKLYNSNFYTYRLLYDNASKEILCERFKKNISAVSDLVFTVQFKPSNNITSKFLFKVNNNHYNEISDYSQYINCNRNNEITLFNNDYLNYMRSGYNYDVKAKQQQTTSSWLSTGISLAGTVAGTIAGIATGNAIAAATAISMATSTIASIANNINQSISSETAIQNKIEQLKQQSGNISGSDDINLLKFYNDNKLKSTIDQCSDKIKQQLYNLFKLTGYACNTYSIPVFNSRIWYNFIQCSPDFNFVNIPAAYIDDIKARFQTGITIYHKNNDEWNFNQNLENFESWLFE